MKTLLLISLAVLAGAQIVSAQGGGDYWPTNVGDYWVMLTDTLECEDPDPDHVGMRTDVEGTDIILDQEYFRVKQVAIKNDGSWGEVFYLWAREDSTGIVVAAIGDTSIVDSATIFDPPQLFLPNQIEIGYSWEFDWPGEDLWLLSIESISKTVQVPAGNFDNCLMTQQVTVDTVTGDTTRISYNYWAQDVGNVLEIKVFPTACRTELGEYFTTSVDEDGITEIPAHFHLQQNYPNPFNPVTRIQFRVQSLKLREPIHTTLKVYNILGQKARTLVDEPKRGGSHEVIWDGKDEKGKEVAGGIYFYQLKAGDFTETKKMLLLK